MSVNNDDDDDDSETQHTKRAYNAKKNLRLSCSDFALDGCVCKICLRFFAVFFCFIFFFCSFTLHTRHFWPNICAHGMARAHITHQT